MSRSNNAAPVIGVGVLVWREKKLLLGKRKAKDQAVCWQFPGGHLEYNESVASCARREVLEETGLSVKNFRHLGFTDKTFDMAQRKYITLLVSCDYDAGEARVLEPEKCAGWQWFDYPQLPAPLFKPIVTFIEQYAAVSQSLAAKPGQQPDLYAMHCASPVLPCAPLSAHK